MRTTLPVVIAVLAALSGVVAVGAISIMSAYVSNAPAAKTNNTPSPTTTASQNPPAQQQPIAVKLTQQLNTNQTCSGDHCSHEQGDD